MIESIEAAVPRIGAVGLSALRKTRPWALFISVVVLVGAAANLVRLVWTSIVGPTIIMPANFPPSFVSFSLTTTIVMAAIAVLFGGLGGWFALQYGRGIKICLDTGDPARLEDALRWQKRFWTLQGVGLIVGIVLGVVMFIFLIVMSVMAAQFGAYQA